MKKVFIFSGLGADKRAFQNINFSFVDTKFINWIPPLKNEKIEEYAYRISNQIDSENPILIGLSFGGMIATEVAKQLKTEKIILISSAKSSIEIPTFYKILGKFNLDRIVPALLLKQPNALLFWAFGVVDNNDKILLSEIIKDTDSIFLKWAIRKIITWQCKSGLENIVHIHGTKDKILPFKNIENPIVVINGGHFMTINKAVEIEKIIKSEIEILNSNM